MSHTDTQVKPYGWSPPRAQLRFYVTEELLLDDIYSRGGYPMKKTKVPRDKRTKVELARMLDVERNHVIELQQHFGRNEDKFSEIILKLTHKLEAEQKLRESCAVLSEALMRILKALDE